jgi:hypothetical protein
MAPASLSQACAVHYSSEELAAVAAAAWNSAHVRPRDWHLCS